MPNRWEDVSESLKIGNFPYSKYESASLTKEYEVHKRFAEDMERIEEEMYQEMMEEYNQKMTEK